MPRTGRVIHSGPERRLCITDLVRGVWVPFCVGVCLAPPWGALLQMWGAGSGFPLGQGRLTPCTTALPGAAPPQDRAPSLHTSSLAAPR